MAPPTLGHDIGGLLTLVCMAKPPTFTSMDSAGSGRWRLITDPSRALRNPDRKQGRRGASASTFRAAIQYCSLGRLADYSVQRRLGRYPGYPGADLQVGRLFRGRGPVSRRSFVASCTYPVIPEPSPASWQPALYLTGTFQGQLFHPRLASTGRYAPRAHGLPRTGQGGSPHSIDALRGARMKPTH
jgi:hypothetical protein